MQRQSSNAPMTNATHPHVKSWGRGSLSPSSRHLTMLSSGKGCTSKGSLGRTLRRRDIVYFECLPRATEPLAQTDCLSTFNGCFSFDLACAVGSTIVIVIPRLGVAPPVEKARRNSATSSTEGAA
jgi:hypothetical protein